MEISEVNSDATKTSVTTPIEKANEPNPRSKGYVKEALDMLFSKVEATRIADGKPNAKARMSSIIP